MKNKTKQIERATTIENRTGQAIRSMRLWLRDARALLDRENELFQQEMTKRPHDCDDLKAALQENRRRREEIANGVENSSLIHFARKNCSGGTAATGREFRSILFPGVATPKPRKQQRGYTQPKILGTLSGYAAVFDCESANLGGFVETIAPGAFANALKNSDVRLLVNHDPDHLLGRSSSGSLTLHEDRVGLRFECDVAQTPYGQEIVSRVGRGDLSQCSFSFVVANGGDRWQLATRPGEIDTRVITEIEELVDVGPVTYPAYPQDRKSVV